MADIVLIARASYFATVAHRRQRRKDREATPYVNHLAEVAFLLAEAGCDANLVAAGYLHDVVEDTAVVPEQLQSEFGDDITSLVLAVTDDKLLEKTERKRLQIERAPLKSPREANLALADKISNLRSLDAVIWEPARVRDYVAWAHQVATGLRDTNPWLWAQYEDARGKALGL